MALNLSEGLLEETFAQLRRCGAGARECVCYWSGPIDVPEFVDAVLHPRHVGHRGFYEVDGDWLNATWVDLAKRKRTIRVQVHTHAGEAFHSQLDDDFPIVQIPGFLSLVVPEFASGTVSLDRAYLTRLIGENEWQRVDPRSWLGLPR